MSIEFNTIITYIKNENKEKGKKCLLPSNVEPFFIRGEYAKSNFDSQNNQKR